MKTIPFILTLGFTCAALVQSDPSTNADAIEKLKFNRTLYRRYDHGSDLRLQAKSTNKDVARNLVTMVNGSWNANKMQGQRPDLNDDSMLKLSASQADLVVIGNVIRNISSFTEKNAFLLTDSEVQIQRVLGQSPFPARNGSIYPDSVITVTSPGGNISIDGHRISASDSATTTLKNHHRYVLFLKYIPESRSYRRVGLEGYDITQPLVTAIHASGYQPLQAVMTNRDLVITSIANSTSKASLNTDGTP